MSFLVPLASMLGKEVYEASGAKRAVHKIPIVGNIASMLGFQKGGRVPRDGTYLLHEGEVVIPSKVVSQCQRRYCGNGVVRRYAQKRPQRVRVRRRRRRRK